MATHTVRTESRDSLAKFLGWFSVGLGVAQVSAPRAMCRLVGASDERRAPDVMRLMGARELTQGLGILTRPRPTAWLWSRVAGDALDLSLLALVAARGDRRARTALAVANVAAIAVPDVYESLHLSRKQGEARAGKPIRKAVTINRPREEVEAAWRGASELQQTVAEHGATVSFDDAPGDRGTEIAVEFTHAPRAGELGAVAAKLTGSDVATQLSDALRRLKQEIETGEVVRSEGTPSGHDLVGHLKQRAAQPVEEAAR